MKTQNPIQTANQFKKTLDQFVNNLSQLQQSDLYSTQIKQKFLEKYEFLYSNFERISLEDKNFNDVLTSDDYKRIHCLRLGLKNEGDLSEMVEFLKSPDPAIAIANFLKSSQGHKIANANSGFEDYSDEELVHLFGGLFGLTMSKECVKSLRAEKIGSILGYALAGFSEQDIQEYNDKSKSYKSLFNLGEHLKGKIQERDVEAVFSAESENGLIHFTSYINENKSRNLDGAKTRSHNRLDHTFVNKKTQTIVIGMSTSNHDVSLQEDSYVKGFKSIQLMVEQEYLVDTQNTKTPNPYFGFKVKPYYFFTGRFDANEQETLSQQRSMKFLKTIGDVSIEEKMNLGQLQYFALMARSVWKNTAQTLIETNCFIAGCDTLKIHQWQKAVIQKYQNKPEKAKEALYAKEFFKKSFEVLTTSMRGLNKTNVFENYSGVLDITLKNMHEIASQARLHILRNELSPKDLKNLYEKSVKPLKEEMIQLADKMLKSNVSHFGKTAFHYEAFNQVLDTFETLESFSKAPRTLPQPPFVWQNEFDRLQAYNDKKGIFTPKLSGAECQDFQNKAKKALVIMLSTIATDFNNGMLANDEKTFEKISKSDCHKITKMIDKYCDIASGYKKFDEKYTSSNSFMSAFGQFNNKLKPHAQDLANFLEKTIPLILPENLKEEKLIEISQELVYSNFTVNNLWVGDEEPKEKERVDIEDLLTSYFEKDKKAKVGHKF